MDGTFSRKLRVWTNASSVALRESYTAGDAFLRGSDHLGEYEGSAEKLYFAESMIPPGHRPRRKEQAEPYTLQWFLNIEHQRHGRYARWLPRLMEFHKHAGETLLALGHGLGTDWTHYARHGADVVIGSPSTAQLALVRRNFELRGLNARFLHAQLSSIPLEAASVDVIAVNAFNHPIDRDPAFREELYRVLKPGGKVIATVASRYDVDFWVHKVLIWRNWLGLNRREYDASIARYSRRDLLRIFDQFVDHRVHRCHLRRSEVPHGWRWLPLPLLTRIAGRVVVLKAFKPLSVALPIHAAA